MRVLNSRERKRLQESLSKEYGTPPKMFGGLELYEHGGGIWAATRECLTLDARGLAVDSAGLQVLRNGRPTIHGIQKFFREASMTELGEREAKTFIDGGAVECRAKIASYRGHPLDAAEESAGGKRRPGR